MSDGKKTTVGRMVPMGVLTLATVLLSASVEAQQPPRPVISAAEVTANDVYVRSGPSVNHYPVAKLHAGNRVSIVGERGSWYEILPPQGVFSWISAEYVDSVDDKAGVVNGNNVRVRAGSVLADFAKSRSKVQTMLPRGAKVSILGRSPEGFLRIAPPSGVTAWVSRDLVETVSHGAGNVSKGLGKVSPKPPSKGTGDIVSASAVVLPDANATNDETEASASPFAYMKATTQRTRLQGLDEKLEATLAQPIGERKLLPLRTKFQQLADQTEDDFARRYAAGRVEQIDRMTHLAQTMARMEELDEQARRRRRQFMDERSVLHAPPPPMPAGLDVQGELRESALYPPGSLLRRYRLVDPSTPRGRTIGYVEVPRGSTLNVDQYLGRFVGIRSTTRRLQPDSVDPIPIYVASEFVPLQRPDVAKEDSDG